MGRLRRYGLWGLLVGLGLALGLVVSLLQWADRRIPSPHRLRDIRQPVTSVVYDRNGQLIHEFFRENRVLVPLAEIPRTLIDGVLATEDRKFYSHWGLDVAGITRAALENLRSGRRSQGGSTITQQLARGMFLSHERTWSRKILEALLAVRIERMYSKDEILTMYLNQVYYGEGVYGVQAAAHHFFGKDVADLDTAEAALLVAVPANPSVYNPNRHPEAALARRNRVLRTMQETGGLTADQAASAAALPLALIAAENAPAKAPYFVELVRLHLQERYGADQVYEGGLKVFTTLDLELQQVAETALEEHLQKLEEKIKPEQTREAYLEAVAAPAESTATDDAAVPVRLKYLQGALLAMDARTGHVYSLVGGRNFSESAFNRATQAHRQPGSAFKPFIYTAAFDNGFRTSDIVLDTPVVFQGKTEEDEWRPQNYNETFLGPITIRHAFKKSINVPAIKVLRKVGVSEAAKYAHRLGIRSNIENVLSVALGTSEVTLEELIASYTAFANQGIRVEPLYILRVEDRAGDLLEVNTSKREEVLSIETTALMNSMLQSVIDSGTGKSARWRGLVGPAGGKTGTTDSYTDGWFIGFTSEVVCGTWVGFDEAVPIGERMDGARVALPIWTRWVVAANEQMPPRGFPLPATIVRQRVCAESGRPARGTCPEPLDEIFKRGTEPEGLCDFPHAATGEQELDPDRHSLRDLERLGAPEERFNQRRLE